MPSQSNFNQQLNFQRENASYQQNKLQMLLPNNVSFMDSFDHQIPIIFQVMLYQPKKMKLKKIIKFH
jgi:hypothetical protein